MLDMIRRDAFGYFLHETNRANGLVLDKTCRDWPASIAAVGLGLTAHPVGVERGLIARAEAVERTLTTLRFFRQRRQGPEPDATGYKGFYYHFLDMHTGARALQCDLSTVDSALLLAGMLAAAEYFAGGVLWHRLLGGAWGGQCLSMRDYVTGTGATRRATAAGGY